MMGFYEEIGRCPTREDGDHGGSADQCRNKVAVPEQCTTNFLLKKRTEVPKTGAHIIFACCPSEKWRLVFWVVLPLREVNEKVSALEH